MRHTKWIVVVFVMLLVLAFSAPAAMADSVIAKVKERGVLRVGFDTFVPWAMKNKEGAYIGFEIDVATRLAKDSGFEVEFAPTKWDGIIPALLTGKFDVIIGGMGITEERLKKVDFTIPYEHSGMSMMAGKKKAPGLKSIEDFNKPDIIIAVKIGTTAAKAAKEFMPKAELRQFGDEAQAVQEVLNGAAHAMVASAPLPAHQAFKFSDQLYLPMEETFTQEPIGMVLRKDQPETLKFLNKWIKKVKAEGWLKERMQYWFGSMKWEDQIK